MPYIRNPIFPWQFPLSRRRVRWAEVPPAERARVILSDELALAPESRDRALWRIAAMGNTFRAVLLAGVGAAALASPASATLVGTLDVSASSPSFSADILNEPLASAASGYFSLPVGTGQILLAIDQAADTFLVRLIGAPSLVSASWAVTLPDGYEASPESSGALGAGTGDGQGNPILSSGLITISDPAPPDLPVSAPSGPSLAPIELGSLGGGLGQVAAFGLLCLCVALGWRRRFATGEA